MVYENGYPTKVLYVTFHQEWSYATCVMMLPIDSCSKIQEILAEGKKAYKKAKEQYEEEVKKMQLKKAQDQATMITGAKE